jgi:RimJ/RimL family protein N-acetyltransferase
MDRGVRTYSCPNECVDTNWTSRPGASVSDEAYPRGPESRDRLVESSTQMQVSISFRPLERSDFPLLQEWLAAPHVVPWWNERTDLASVEAKYGPRVDGCERTHVFVIEQEGRPIGWIQWYLWADYPDHAQQLGAGPSSAGIDLAIGEFKMTGLGLGPVAIREFTEQIVFVDPAICAIITDPEEINLRSLRAFEKSGFQVVKIVQLAGEHTKRRVLRLDRR